MKTYCSIPFDKELWEELNNEMDIYGNIVLEDIGTSVQVMPVDEFHFTPSAEQVIEIVLNYASQIALGLLVNWLYDKLKQRKIKKVVINNEVCDLMEKCALENAITKKPNERA